MRRRVRRRRKVRVIITWCIVVFALLIFVRQIGQAGRMIFNRLEGREVYAETIGKVTKGEFPLLLQDDRGWGKAPYGDGTIKENGCAPTSLSMVIAGLTEENTVTPYTVAKYAEKHGYYINGTGTSWDLFTEGCKDFGIEGNVLKLSKETVQNTLNSGMPIICSMRPGDFTTIGHIIVLTGTEDGKIKVNDPNSKENSKRLWDYETLEYQIKNLWAFHVI